MATYSSSLQAVHRPSAPGCYLISNTIDIAVENTNNAAALAADDILKIFTLPKDTLIMAAGFEVEALLTGWLLCHHDPRRLSKPSWFKHHYD